MLAVATGPPLDHLWMWQDEDALVVDVGALLSWIRSLKKRKTRKGTTTLIFCRELHRILWTASPSRWCLAALADCTAGCILVWLWTGSIRMGSPS